MAMTTRGIDVLGNLIDAHPAVNAAVSGVAGLGAAGFIAVGEAIDVVPPWAPQAGTVGILLWLLAKLWRRIEKLEAELDKRRATPESAGPGPTPGP